MKQWMSKLFTFNSNDQRFAVDINPEGVDVFVEKSIFSAIAAGKASDFITAQYVALKMLEEQGNAEPMPGGFILPTKTVVSLEDDLVELLGLPERWQGEILADIKGATYRDSFKTTLLVTSPSGNSTAAYEIKGPCIQFGSLAYTLDHKSHLVFDAVEKYKQSVKCEYDNLAFVHSLQMAKAAGANLTLQQFESLKIHVPDKITIDAELDAAGNLILTPNAGQQASHDEMQRVMGQIMAEAGCTIKVGKEIILFDNKRAEAVKEVLTNRVIARSQVQQFLKTPTAFLDATLVDLDVGFALRVKGAIRFKHAYFGETDESGINWFGASGNSASIQPFSAVAKLVQTKEDLLQLQQQVSDAKATGATELTFQGKLFEISNQEEITKTLDKIKQRLEAPTDSAETEPDGTDETTTEGEVHNEVIVVDIALNDESLDLPSKAVQQSIEQSLYRAQLDWSNYKRTAFDHQELGVRWILGLEEIAREKDLINGALLADDMGLGKTFMSLAAVDQYYKLCDEQSKTAKPTLVVAPLSLIENWRDEVNETFSISPFRDVVILQSEGELSRFRDGGIETKASNIDDDTFEPKTSLLFGDDAGVNRLDMPKRLVITTYQTLRDYQFSMSKIDWGIVVFDEAQNIKNPNALQTRAAKGLKAQFKLLATGTPVENSLADFWCLMDTCCPGFLDSYQVFRQTYITPILQAAGDEVDNVRASLGRALREKVGHLMLRRIKEDNLKDLPQKRIFVGLDGQDWVYHPPLHSVMQGHQLKVYEGTIEAQVENENSHVLTTLQRLRDSSLHPRLVDSGQLVAPSNRRELTQVFEESAKLASVISILNEIKARKEKCIIFAVNKRLQRFLGVALGQYFDLGPLHIINGDAKAVENRGAGLSRKAMIRDFESKNGFNIIIMSPVAAGVGLTVVGANNVIHFERHWNPAKEAQATDRVYRIGQKKDVNIYVPVLHHPRFESFDVNLHKLLSRKTLLKDAVVKPQEVLPNPDGADSKGITPNSIIGFDEIDKISWMHFEALCLELLAREYEAQSAYLTNDGPDYGADGILLFANNAVIIQAKHKKGAYSGYSAVQEIDQAARMYQSWLKRPISKRIFITNASKLAAKTREVAQTLNVEVIDGAQLQALCEKHSITYGQVLSRINKQRYVIDSKVAEVMMDKFAK